MSAGTGGPVVFKISSVKGLSPGTMGWSGLRLLEVASIKLKTNTRVENTSEIAEIK